MALQNLTPQPQLAILARAQPYRRLRKTDRLFCFSIRPFVRFWRRLGLRLALGINCAGLFVLAALIFVVCKPLLSVEFGTNPVLIGLAVPLLVVSGAMRKRLSKYLHFGI